MKRFTKNLLAIIVSFTIAACSVGSKLGPPVNHDLGPSTERTTESIILTLDAPIWLWDEQIRYRLLFNDATIVRYYHRDRWEAPLPSLLERRLNIHSAQPITLQIQLTQFEQQFEATNNSHVLMSLAVSAFTSKDYQLLGRKSFSLSQKTVSPDVAGAIAGFVTLTEKARNDIQGWIGTLSKNKLNLVNLQLDQ